MQMESKYARAEWERRFLLERFPAGAEVKRTHRIIDRYILGTTLRLRRLTDDAGETFKLTQKIPAGRDGALRGAITTMYLREDEYDVFAALPTAVLTKTRFSVPPLGIDVFDGPLSGLVLAEAEFGSGADAAGFAVPSYVTREVTEDERFEGGRLATASGGEVEAWVAEYGLVLRTR